jgi:hypothetical protein
MNDARKDGWQEDNARQGTRRRRGPCHVTVAYSLTLQLGFRVSCGFFPISSFSPNQIEFPTWPPVPTSATCARRPDHSPQRRRHNPRWCARHLHYLEAEMLTVRI